jgi:hypothetical protein
MTAKSGHPLVQAFQDNVADMIRMQEEVLDFIPKPSGDYDSTSCSLW